MEFTDSNNHLFIPVGNDTTQTTTSTSYTGMAGSTFFVDPARFSGGWVKARLYARCQNQDTSDDVYFRVFNGVDSTEMPASTLQVSIPSAGGWENAYGPEFEIRNPSQSLKDYSIRWKVDGGTGEASGGAGVGVLVYW